ncbi:hypothetical protein F4861DRAFT_491572 [Xylaria intraflava]|nr:hypothetical protein F4861DRAFT_491572 [Xylaria intraflava]
MPPSPPTTFERDYWYHGVGGTLLARTSTFDFRTANTGNERTIGSIRFTNIGHHNVVSLWSGEVVRCLQRVLEEVRWERIYPIRTELVWPYNDDTLNDLRKRVVLIIEVPRGTVEFDEASAAALRCRMVLDIFKIVDVEVEIREINRQPYAMDVDLRDHIHKRNWALEDLPLSPLKISYETFLPALSNIGYEITPEFEKPWRYGTMGVHIRLSDRPSEFYGLTCRHVAHRPTAGLDLKSHELWNWAPDRAKYLSDKDPAERHRIIQMCPNSLETLRFGVKTELQDAERESRRLDMKRNKHSSDPSYPEPTEDEINLHARLRRAMPFVEEIDAALSHDHIQEADGRAIGHVAVMPPFEVSAKGFLRDWALIRLNEAKFNGNGEITNKIFVSKQATKDLRRGIRDHETLHGIREHETLREMETFIEENRDGEGFIRLQGSSQAVSPNHDRKSMVVGKYGAASRLTFGVTNEIKAIVQVDQEQRLVGWEWIIVGLEPSVPFSKKGDSGAVVFNSSGSTVAVISVGDEDGSTARRLWTKHSDVGDELSDDPGEGGMDQQSPADFESYRINTDLTFATPIDVILDDIKLITKSNVEII